MEIEPKYVTYEQAKWIKEKGFNIPCREGWYIAQLDPYKGQLFPDDTGGKHEIEKPEQHQVVESNTLQPTLKLHRYQQIHILQNKE
jgi:hypothetical protein